MSHLDLERQKASFDSRKLAEIFYTLNGQCNLNTFLDFQKKVYDDPILKFDQAELELSRKDLMTRVTQMSARIHEIFGLSNPQVFTFGHVLRFPMLAGVHNVMFLPTIVNLGTEEQAAKYVSDAASLKIFGCYAQTELGHGSDVQSLETIATYDPSTEEFILQSPTVSSMKWWPGELGVSATHAVTHAQLIVKGKRYGVQTFVVPIRDPVTHLPLKGITVGDIGPKMGYTVKDNGYLKFDNVRIPRENLLMRYVKLDKEGNFKKEGNDKIAYATMMWVRLNLIEGAYTALAIPATIATRYATFRKQFRDAEGKERVIMDYQLHQNKLLPVLAAIYGMNAGHKKITRLYHDMMKGIKEKSDFTIMPELHSLLSGCKSFYTWEALYDMEICRQACGGHGFSAYAGINTIFNAYSPNVTLEGDNTVMALQVARYLVKCAQYTFKGGKLPGSVEYLELLKDADQIKPCSANSKNDFDSFEELEKAMQVGSVRLIGKALQKLLKFTQEGLPYKEIWDKKVGIDLVAASRAHIEYFTFRSFRQVIQEEYKDEKIARVMRKLCLLYGIEKLLDHPLGVTGYFSQVHFDLIQEKKEELLDELRPEALALTDAFSFLDASLNSALALPTPYETMYEWASKTNSINKEVPNAAFMKYMKPVMGKYSHLNPKPKL